jgi:hypothetical protein
MPARPFTIAVDKRPSAVEYFYLSLYQYFILLLA